MLQVEEDIEGKRTTKFAWPEMVIQTQCTEILDVRRLYEKQWEFIAIWMLGSYTEEVHTRHISHVGSLLASPPVA